MTSRDLLWVGGDGGPLVLLPRSLWYRWRGATDGGGDYESVCLADNDVHVVRLLDTELVVLGDSSWPAAFVRGPTGHLAVVQDLGMNSQVEIGRYLFSGKADDELEITMHESQIVLAVGADCLDSEGRSIYPTSQAELSLGCYRVLVYYQDDAVGLEFAKR